MSDDLARRRRYRRLLAARAISLGVITGLAGSVLAWGVQHHARTLVVDACLIFALVVVVMLLSWSLND